MESLESKISVLTEKVQHLTDAEGRHSSHYKSEQEFRKEQGKLLDDARRLLQYQQEQITRQGAQITKLDDMLRDPNTGLMFRMRDQETKQLSWREWTAMAISIGSLLYAIFGK